MIKQLTTSDIYEAEKLVYKMVQMSAMSALEYDREKTLLQIYDFVINPDKLVIGYVYKGKLIGLFGATIFQYFTSDDKVACENMWFVLEEYRLKTRAGYSLLKAFDAWASDNNVKLILAGTGTGIQLMDKIAKMYHKIGFNTSGYTFTKQLD